MMIYRQKLAIFAFMIARSITLLLVAFLSTVASATVPKTIAQGDDLSCFSWNADKITFADLESLNLLFSIDTIADVTMARMVGKSYPEKGCEISRSDLCYLILPHYDGKGAIRIGEMVCNKAIAGELTALFKELFRHKYPIERMVLIDNYDADDIKSMEANNTSCFNYRTVAGSRKLSRHALGMAIDINPLYNPYVKGSYVSPESGKPYINRRKNFKHKLYKGDIVYQILHDKYGFTWGGTWRSCKDYQHYEK